MIGWRIEASKDTSLDKNKKLTETAELIKFLRILKEVLFLFVESCELKKKASELAEELILLRRLTRKSNLRQLRGNLVLGCVCRVGVGVGVCVF